MFSRLRPLLSRIPGQPFGEGPPVVPVVRLSGVIAASAVGPIRSGMLNLATLAGPLRRAFKFPGAKAVALAINSPGGSPVQSSLIASRIRQHAEEEKLPVLAFVEDVAASGGYWLATAADEIFANEGSILGSIGVISAGFGFQTLMQRLGVERRVHTRGDRKGLLDPFKPERPEDLARLERIQRQIHEQFIAQVRSRRGARLDESDGSGLFEGEIFLGRDAQRLGLIDGLGDLRGEVQRRYGAQVLLPVIGADRRMLRLNLGLTRAPDVDATLDGILTALERRALWSRYGL